MKKLLFVLLLFGLFTSCKGKESTNETKTENRSKEDDQSNNGKKNEENINSLKNNNNNADDLDEDGNSKSDVESINGQDDSDNAKGWPQVEIDGFVRSCIREAVKGGMERQNATDYCNCMQEKMENKYPDIKVATRLTKTQISSLMTKDAADCLDK